MTRYWTPSPCSTACAEADMYTKCVCRCGGTYHGLVEFTRDENKGQVTQATLRYSAQYLYDFCHGEIAA